MLFGVCFDADPLEYVRRTWEVVAISVGLRQLATHLQLQTFSLGSLEVSLLPESGMKNCCAMTHAGSGHGNGIDGSVEEHLA